MDPSNRLNILDAVLYHGGSVGDLAGAGVEQGGPVGSSDVVSVTLANIVSNISKRSSELVLADLNEILSDSAVSAYTDRIFPYLYAAGFLAYTGRDVTADSIEKVLTSAGFKPERRISEALAATGVKNNIVYFHAFYFMIVMGMEVNADNMRRVLDSIGIKADAALSDSIIALYKDAMLP